MLIALSISAVTDENAKKAVMQLPNLKGCEIHTTVILSQVDENVFRSLGINLTSQPTYENNKYYNK